MSKSIISDERLTAIGDAIRSKNNATDKYTPDEMAKAINDITISGKILIDGKTVSKNDVATFHSYPSDYKRLYFAQVTQDVSGDTVYPVCYFVYKNKFYGIIQTSGNYYTGSSSGYIPRPVCYELALDGMKSVFEVPYYNGEPNQGTSNPKYSLYFPCLHNDKVYFFAKLGSKYSYKSGNSYYYGSEQTYFFQTTWDGEKTTPAEKLPPLTGSYATHGESPTAKFLSITFYYNGKLYGYLYDNGYTYYTYDIDSQTYTNITSAISNNLASAIQDDGYACVYENKLFYYSYMFDGITETSIPKDDSARTSQPFIYKNMLYMKYVHAEGSLVRWDFSKLDNGKWIGVVKNISSLYGNIYNAYNTHLLAKSDGSINQLQSNNFAFKDIVTEEIS